MKKDSLQEFVSLRSALLKEREQLESRLAEIQKVLGSAQGSAPAAAPAPRRRGRKPAAAAPAAAPAAARPRGRAGRPKGGKRVQNELSLKEAVTRVVKDKPLSAQEIIAAVGEIGYKFAAKNPVNSLRTLLYTEKKSFKNVGGKFTVA